MKFFLLSSLLLMPVALACNHEHMARQAETNQSLPFEFIEGNDPPADPATKGYFINHVGMIASDLNRTREWYSSVLGMRHIFTMKMSPEYTVMYMGHSQGGRNGTGYQSGHEMSRDKNNLAGLVEFQQYSGAANRNYDALSSRMTFSHFGLIVDDIKAAQDRFESLGVRIIKRYNELDFTGDTEESRIMGGAWGFDHMTSEEQKADIAKTVPALEASGFKQFCIVADPDGNLFEVQALVPLAI